MKRILLCLLCLILFAGIFVLRLGLSVSSQSRNEDSYTVRVYNVDDLALVYVNGIEIIRAEFKGTDQRYISNLLRPGHNEIRFVLRNYKDSYTYGFELYRGNEIVHSYECGLVDNSGCSKSTQTGVVFDRSVTINYSGGSASNSVYNAVNYDGRAVSNRVYITNTMANAMRAAEIAANAAENAVRPVKLGGIPRVTAKTIKENDSSLRLNISARYPQISGSQSADNFNSITEQLVRKHISDFKQGLDCYAENRPCELDIGYKLGLVSNRIVSVEFWEGFDTGGAHPNAHSFVLNYDLGRQQVLSLDELFSNPDYLRTISDYCIRRLRNQVSDYESLRDGASPNSDNYDSWLITKTGLQITFDAYQVASYAEGPKTVLVPWSAVKRFIAVGSPIKHLVK